MAPEPPGRVRPRTGPPPDPAAARAGMRRSWAEGPVRLDITSYCDINSFQGPPAGPPEEAAFPFKNPGPGLVRLKRSRIP